MKVLFALLCLLTVASPADTKKSNELPVAAVKPNQLPVEAATALKTGTKFVLFSLEPPISVALPQITPDMTDQQKRKEEERYLKETKLDPEKSHHGYKILGSTELSDAPSRASAIGAITEAIRGFDGNLAHCFEPRHSLRVIAANGTTYDFVACFQCRQVYVFRGKKRIGTAGMTGSQKRLDDLLVEAKVQLAKPASAK